MNRGELAKEYFLKGYNCSQAVLLAFSDLTGLDAPLAAKLAAPFGGGMGRQREVCGAVSGMLMVFGILHGYDAASPTAAEDKKLHYTRVQELCRRFREGNGSIVCRELLASHAARLLAEKQERDAQTDAMLSDAPTPTPRTEAYYQKRPCPELVAYAAELLQTYLDELNGSDGM